MGKREFILGEFMIAKIHYRNILGKPDLGFPI